MDLLKSITSSILIPALVLPSFSGCSNMSITETIPLETDTFISSSNPSSSNAELDYVAITKTASTEDRALLKLPTTKKDDQEVINDLLEDAFVTLFFLPFEILSMLISCKQQVLQSGNLTNAELVFDVQDSQSQTLAGALQLELLSKGWWQSANWTTAHPFSTKGRWAAAGGDLDSSFTPVSATETSGTVHFNITNYFKNLIDSAGTVPHYGFMIRSSGGTLNTVKLKSTQATYYSVRPRLVSTYTGSCLTNSQLAPAQPYERTVYLGAEMKVEMKPVSEISAP